MKNLIILVCTLGVMGCDSAPFCQNADGLYHVALDRVYRAIEHGCQEGAEPARGQALMRRQARMDQLREWALSLSDRCVQDSYMGWIDYYQERLSECQAAYELWRDTPIPPPFTPEQEQRHE